MIKVAVLLGGNSTEREVSLKSGEAIYQNLDSKKYDKCKIELPNDDSHDWVSELIDFAPDMVVSGLHGGVGENGAIQGLLDSLNIPYVGSGTLASAVGMDKAVAKVLLQNAGIPVAKGAVFGSLADFETGKEKILAWGLPVVVKPNDGGSSVGVSIVKDASGLSTAVQKAFETSDEVLIEQFVAGVEATCGVIETLDGLKALDVYTIKTDNEFFDYDAKYSDNTEEKPADFPEEEIKQLQDLAVATFQATKCAGYGRVDFILGDGGKKPIVLEINTLPGMTAQSFMPKMARKYWTFSEFLDLLIVVEQNRKS
ncbi:D-alanine--D-alanine ligase [Alphaproteobacteria bacterium]|nr:D-alanine--D-alanine ligase [Alphaproteobacteria bacterium]